MLEEELFTWTHKSKLCWVGGRWLANYLISAPDLWAAHHSHWLSSFEASVSVSVAPVGRPGTIGGRATYYLMQEGVHYTQEQSYIDFKSPDKKQS